ncbi:uncharacterized protein LOC111053317 [Nilaparvata lugens]|uniref:uncharacterized protein LOC111053317 n=1 Tax=Nilaparvata lugens TaxID=108931 RepID=UPI00193E25C7|nr:uncharacterized protein LOC111053317 [Nilaparvata lugens]
MAAQSDVGRVEPQLHKEPIQSVSGCCDLDQSGESSGDHGTPIGEYRITRTDYFGVNGLCWFLS